MNEDRLHALLWIIIAMLARLNNAPIVEGLAIVSDLVCWIHEYFGHLLKK